MLIEKGNIIKQEEYCFIEIVKGKMYKLTHTKG